jgi:peptidoglycan hydrolase FlgJ
MTSPLTLAPGLSSTISGAALKTQSLPEKARATAQDFEAMFLNAMFGQMFASVGNGPYGGGHAAQVWRSFLTDEYAKTFAKKGGIGIADQVYGSLLQQQEARSTAALTAQQEARSAAALAAAKGSL